MPAQQRFRNRAKLCIRTISTQVFNVWKYIFHFTAKSWTRNEHSNKKVLEITVKTVWLQFV